MGLETRAEKDSINSKSARIRGTYAEARSERASFAQGTAKNTKTNTYAAGTATPLPPFFLLFVLLAACGLVDALKAALLAAVVMCRLCVVLTLAPKHEELYV